MRIIIIGASGTIGRHLFSLAKSAGKKVIGTGHTCLQEGLARYDMVREPLRSLVPDLGPEDVVYLLSAYSNPSWIYEHQDQAIALNLTATKKLIDEIQQTRARIIFMSSVEVFDGESGNYSEAALPNPLNLYGRMKFAIEEYLAQKQCRSCIVRTSWNVGWDFDSRCVVKLTYKSLLQPHAKMAKDNIFSIIDVRDTAEGLLRISDHARLTCCHLASSPAIVRTELAQEIMNFSKHKHFMGFKKVLFSDIEYTEKRSRYNQMDNSLAISLLGMSFRPPIDIIQEKVALLDEHIAELKG